MLIIDFVTEENDPKYKIACQEYEAIWRDLGSKIHKAYIELAGFDFTDNKIVATIHDDISQSHPFKLQSNREHNRKVGDLIHELGHILIVAGPTHPLAEEFGDSNTRSHKALDLILYDVLIEVCGQTFADEQVNSEKAQSQAYKDAWDWALGMNTVERKAKFQSLK